MDDTLSNDKSDGAGTNIMDGNANYDIGLRSVASFVTAILSLSLLFFLIHRLRQRKIQGKIVIVIKLVFHCHCVASLCRYFDEISTT